jgi:YfiH family protein
MNLSFQCGDDAAAVERNRALLQACGVPEVQWLHQVHGSRVVSAQLQADIPEADAGVTRSHATACAVLVADCLPVLLCDERGSVVGAAHAGWRGLASGVLENSVAAMAVDPSQLLAYLGAAIGPERFEVGPEVRDTFCAVDAAAASAFRALGNDKYLADLYLLARQRLARAGVVRVFGGGRCTVSESGTFYSYRRERTTGRMAALIWIAPD